MDLESLALMALLSQVTHQLQHTADNAKSQHTKDIIVPLITALKSAVAGLASS